MDRMLPLRGAARILGPLHRGRVTLAQPRLWSHPLHTASRTSPILRNVLQSRSPSALAARHLATSSKVLNSIPPQQAPDKPHASIPLKTRRSWPRRGIFALKAVAFLIGSSVVGIFVVTGAILAHDALTYSDEKPHDVSVSPLALNPPIGGPKQLPLLVSLIDDDVELEKGTKKERLVIVGGGWGTVGILKTLDPDQYHVTVVAENTYNHFTPLLPSAAVGTVNVRSLVESLRKLLSPLKGHFIYGKAVDLVMSERLLEVQVPSGEMESDGTHKYTNMYLPYDKLVIAVGSVSATYGVNGLQRCFQLKTVEDAQKMRRRIVENFEVASLPTTSPEERKRLLSFVVCGGGPTGVETAAEISDLIHEDLAVYFPKLCTAEATVTIIQSRDHILNTYSESISEYAEKRFEREAVNVIVNARVKDITDTGVVYTVKDSAGKTVEHTIPTNCILWSTGIAMNPFTQRVSDLLPNQVHKKAIVVDSQLRVLGAPMGTVYAVGDASTINTSLMGYLLDLIEASDKNHDERIDAEEWEELVTQIKRRVPLASKYLEKTKDVFKQYDKDGDQVLSFNELTDALVDIGNKITSLPATAQVASQQGKYLGKKFNFLARPSTKEAMTQNEIFIDDDAVHYEPFQYTHLGSLAYIGNAAVFDFSGKSVMGGLAAMYAWRSIYWTEQVSLRTRMLLMIDWVVRGLFGRDLSKL
ncbi:hypothetical protein FRB95_013351 [Tulasnella sp. JGI-2019a]|nr:hypothetical protein FRB95_013351 [Tulasnella sp. JGI-2019a]